jgi:hypothetical protein
MHRGHRYLGSLLLTAALATPVAMMAATSPQDDITTKVAKVRASAITTRVTRTITTGTLMKTARTGDIRQSATKSGILFS